MWRETQSLYRKEPIVTLDINNTCNMCHYLCPEARRVWERYSWTLAYDETVRSLQLGGSAATWTSFHQRNILFKTFLFKTYDLRSLFTSLQKNLDSQCGTLIQFVFSPRDSG